MSKKLFKIADRGDGVLIVETHYYKWLLQQELEGVHSIETKKAYLKENGFNWGVDKITGEDYNRLNAIESVFFNNEIKPKINTFLTQLSK